MADDHTSKLEQELKDRLEEKGILYFGPLGKHYLKDARGQHMPHTPRQQPHGRRPGKRNMMTHLRAYARKNPGSKVPSWLDMEQMSHEEVFNQFKEKFPKLIQANGQIRRIVEGDPNDPEGFNREEAKIQGGTRMQGGGAGKTPTVNEIDIDSAEARQERAFDPKSTRVEPKDREPGKDVVDYNPFGFANERTRAQRAGVKRPEARGPFNRNPQSMFMPGDVPAEQKQEEAIARAEEIRQKAQQAAAQGKNPPAAAAAQYNNKEEQVIVVAEELFRALNELDGAMDGLSSEDRKALSEIEQLGMDNPPAARKKLSEMAANNPRMKKAKEAFDKAAKAARNVAKAANKNGMKQIPSELLEAAAMRVGKGEGPLPEDMGQFEQQMAQPNLDVNAPKSMYGPQQVDYADGVIDARESLDRVRQGNADFQKDFGGDNWPIDRIIKDPPRNEDEIAAAMKQQQKGRADALANAEKDPDNAGQHFAEAQAHEDAMDALQALGKMPADKRDALKRDRKIEQKPTEGGEGGKKPPSDFPVANMPGTQPEKSPESFTEVNDTELDQVAMAQVVRPEDVAGGKLAVLEGFRNRDLANQKAVQLAEQGYDAKPVRNKRFWEVEVREGKNKDQASADEAQVRSLIEDALIGGIDDDIKDGLYESRSEAAKDRLEDISSGDNGYDAWVQDTAENLRNQGQDWVTEDYVKAVHKDVLDNLAGNKKDQEPNKQQQEELQLPERLVTRPARELGIENTQQMRQRNVGTQAQIQDLRLTQEEGDIARQAGKDELAKPQKIDRMRAAGRFVDANIADAVHKERLSNDEIQAKRGEIIGEALLEAGVTNHKDWDKKGPEWVKQLGERFDLRLKGKAETEDELKRARQIIRQEQMQGEQGDWLRQGRLRRREGTQPEGGTGGQPVEPPNIPGEGSGGIAAQGDKAFQRLANPNRNAAKLGQINIEIIDQKAQRLKKLALDAAGPSGASAGSVGGKDNFNGALPIRVVKVDDAQDKKIVTPNPIPRDQAEQIAKRLEAKGIKVDIITHPTASQDDKAAGRAFAVRANNAEMFVVKPQKEAKQENGYREAAELIGVGHLVPVAEIDEGGKVLIEFIDGEGVFDMIKKDVPQFLGSANKHVNGERAAVAQDKDFDVVVDAAAVKAAADDRAFAKANFEFVVEAAAKARLSDSSQSPTPAQAREAAESDVRMIAALDFLLGQPDRHGDNINIGPNGEVRAIDNGFVGLAVIPDPMRFLGNGNGEVPLLQRGVQPNDGPGATATQIQVDVPENIRQIFLQVTPEDIKRMAGNVDADALVNIWTEMIGKHALKHNPKALKDFQNSIKKYFTSGGYETDMLSRLESLQNGSYQYDLKSIKWEDLPYKVKKKYLESLLDKLPSGYSTSDITPQW